MPKHVCYRCGKVKCGCLGVSIRCTAQGCGYEKIEVNPSSHRDRMLLTFLMGTCDHGSCLQALKNQHSILDIICDKSILAVVVCPWECRTPVVYLTQESFDKMYEQNKLDYIAYERDFRYAKWRRKLEYRCRHTGEYVYDDEAYYVGMPDFDSDAKIVSDWGDSDEDSDEDSVGNYW